MKVAIDTGPLTSGHSVRGIGVHTKLLIEHLKKLRGVEIDTVDFSTSDLSKYDIVHYQFFNPFFINLPFFKKTKTVITIHDLIPLVYPSHYPPGLKGNLKFLLNKFLLRNVDAVITISETSKKDIVRFLGIKLEKIHVVYLAQKPIFRKITNKRALLDVRKRYKLPEKFVLYVGDVNYNKNIPGLIKACEKVDTPLVICGKQAMDVETQGMGINDIKGVKDWVRFVFNKPHPELSHFKQILRDFDKVKNIMRLGFVPDEDLVAIYNLATLYCQPSFYEGFGIPLLEAMACGTPVVAARNQVHVEIAEGGALFANPKDVEDMANKIGRFLKDGKLQREYSLKGKKIVGRFSWDKTAKETLQVYSQV